MPNPGACREAFSFLERVPAESQHNNFDKSQAEKYLQDVASAKDSNVAWHRGVMNQERNRGNFQSNFNQEMGYFSKCRGGGRVDDHGRGRGRGRGRGNGRVLVTFLRNLFRRI